MNYISIKGESPVVNFEEAVLAGYAPDGGLYVPESLPKVSYEMLKRWKPLSYKALVFEIASLFIPRVIIQ